MLIQEQKFPQCAHIKVNGIRCGSPSLHDNVFCYCHNRARRLRPSPVLPFLEDANAVQFAVSEVLQAIAEERIEPKAASIMIYGLQVAAYNLRTGGVNFEPYAPRVVRTDPAEEWLQDAMKKLPANSSSDDVLKILRTAAKG